MQFLLLLLLMDSRVRHYFASHRGICLSHNFSRKGIAEAESNCGPSTGLIDHPRALPLSIPDPESSRSQHVQFYYQGN